MKSLHYISLRFKNRTLQELKHFRIVFTTSQVDRLFSEPLCHINKWSIHEYIYIYLKDTKQLVHNVHDDSASDVVAGKTSENEHEAV